MRRKDDAFPSPDYLSLVVALGKQLSTLNMLQEQLYAYCECVKGIFPWVERTYIPFFGEGTDRIARIFLFEKDSRGLTILGEGALTREEKRLFVLFRNQRERKRRSQLSEPRGGGTQLREALDFFRGEDTMEEAAPGTEVRDEADEELDGNGLNLLAILPLASSLGSEGWILFVGTGEKTVYLNDEERNAVSICTDMLSASLDKARLFDKVLHAKREWERTVDAIRNVVMIVGTNFKVHRGNQQLSELTLTPLRALEGKVCHKLLYSLDTPCPDCPAVETFKTRSEASAEVFRKDRQEVFQVSSYPILGPDGQLESVAVYEKDITEYTQMQQKLVQAEKMSVLGQLAAAVAHELNNPLSGVISFSQIMLKEMDPELRHYDDIQNIEHAAQRCKKIVEDLLAFARRPETITHEGISLRTIIEQAVTLMGPKLEARGIRMEIQCAPDLPQLSIHPDPLHQILVNLISNAHDAMATGGSLLFKAETTNRRGKPFLLLLVRDSGPGIPQKHLKRIFEPFYTTKGPGEGTGLGLCICERLMDSFGGRMEVASEAGKGTTFKLLFPV